MFKVFGVTPVMNFAGSIIFKRCYFELTMSKRTDNCLHEALLTN